MRSFKSPGENFQFFSGFQLPFPFNILLSPVVVLEWYLKATVVAGAMADANDKRMLAEVLDPTADGSFSTSFAEGCVRWANCSCALADPVGLEQLRLY